MPAAPPSLPPQRRWPARRGRILAVKWGVNPNSSSLGADVTFLLFGMITVALLTPLVALALRARGWLHAAPQQSAAPDPATLAPAAPDPAPTAPAPDRPA